MSNNVFNDKKNEINQFINYIIKIISDQKSKWKVTPETYSVTIQDDVYRTFSKDELESFEKQVMYLQKKLRDEDIIKNNKRNFCKFLQILNNIKTKHQICNKPYCFVHDPLFYGDQYRIYKPRAFSQEEEELSKRIGESFKYIESDDNSMDQFNFGFKDYYSIGNSILNGKDTEKPEILRVLFNVVLNEDFNPNVINNFKKKVLFKLKSFDPIKVGRELTKYIFSNRLNLDHSLSAFKGNSLLSNESFQKLSNFLEKRKQGISLLIVNVPKPAHTYHLIQASHVVMNSNKNNISKFNCQPQKIIFCIEDHNFQQLLNNLTNCSDGSTYYIVHPENLKSDEMQSLKSFISARRSQRIKMKDKKKNDQNLPTVIIITALPPAFFDLYQSNAEAFEDYESFEENDISEFATFNSKWRSFSGVNNDVFLFSSQQPGIGKTYHINKIIEEAKKIKIKDVEKKINSDHIYLDITTEEIPARIKGLDIIHISISPELFQNNFRLMDQLYLLIQYGYFIFQNGSPISYVQEFHVKPTFLIEIPNLGADNEFKYFYDFPIAPNNNEDFKENTFQKNENASLYPFIKQELDQVEDKSEFNKGHFYLKQNDNKIYIDPDVKKLASLVFKDITKIEEYDALIQESQSLFFPGQALENEGYKKDNRNLSKVQQMLNDYSKLINEQNSDDETKKILFLLTIRTILYIWHFNVKDSQNLIILVPRRLMTNTAFNAQNGWIIVSFIPNDSSIQWNSHNLNLDSIQNDQDFCNLYLKKFQNKEFISILTDNANSANDIALQTQFFKTILLFLPQVDYSANANSPFQIANILLSLFSNMDHYPEIMFESIMNDLKNQHYTINNLKSKFKEQYNIEWTEADELLSNYLKANQSTKLYNINQLIIQLKSELSQESIWNIIKMSFSKTYFCRFIEIIIKIYYRHFSILQGDTGCGKTSVINLISDILSLAHENSSMKSSVNWSFYRIDFHGNFTQKDFKERIEFIEADKSVHSRETVDEFIIIFLDELNTSPAYYYVIDQIQNKENRFFSYIGAINAKEVVSETNNMISCVGIPQKIVLQLSTIKLFSSPPKDIKSLTFIDQNHYAYNVKEDQESVKSSIIMSDPHVFDSEKESKFLPDEEKIAIRSITTKILLQWKNSKFVRLKDVIEVISDLINNIFLSVRTFMDLRAIFSYRDVHRCVTIFTYVFDFLLKHIKNDNKKLYGDNSYKNKMTSISIVVSVYVSLVSRFSHEKIEINDEINERFKKVKFTKSNPFSMYELVLKFVHKQEETFTKHQYPFFTNWEQISVLLAYAKCMKYINFVKKKDIYPIPSLMLHLLILTLTISASFHDINQENDENESNSSSSSFFTCLIIGMPGTSKSKAVEIFKNYHLDSKKHKHEYFITTYMCSRTSDSDSLLSQFLNGARFLGPNSKNKKAIVILEEVGLANYNPSRPLKILHPLCDKGVQVNNIGKPEYRKIIPVQLSNYAIDFANMNRGFLICAGLPSDDELSVSISFGKMLRKLRINKEFSKSLVSKMLEDDPNDESTCYKLDDYEKIIDYLLKTSLFDTDENKIKTQTKRLAKNKIFYNKLFETLWIVTQKDGKRPNFFPMRPLFSLISLVDDVRYGEDYSPQLFTYLLNAFTHDKDIIQRSCYANSEFVKGFLEPLHQIDEYVDDEEENYDPVKLYNLFSDKDSERKAILIRTKDYEAYQYLSILDTTDSSFVYNFVPFEFQDVGQDCQNKFDELYKYIIENNDEQYKFVSVGNDPFSDYIIDILNVINQEDQCPTAILKGFPIYLPCFPENIKFIFIINNSDIYNQELTNPVPYPLIDRLDHLFIDKEILQKYFVEYDEYSDIHTKYLLGLAEEPEEEPEEKPKGKHKENPEEKRQPTKKDLLLTYDKSDFYYLMKALKDESKGDAILENHFKNTSLKSLNRLLDKLDSDIISIKSVVVFTRTPFYEEFDFKEKRSFTVINDDHKNLKEKLSKVHHRKSILIKSDIFIFSDDNTLNHALSIMNEVLYKIYTNFEAEANSNEENEKKDDKEYSDEEDNDEEGEKEDDDDDDKNDQSKRRYNERGKNKYIIVFNINENYIPSAIQSTQLFPVVWIESLASGNHNELPLIQEICSATYHGKLLANSSIITRGYEQMLKNIKDKLEPDQQKNVTLLFTDGIEISTGAKQKTKPKKTKTKHYKIGDILDCLGKSKGANNNSEKEPKTLSFEDVKKDLIKKLDELSKAEKSHNEKQVTEIKNYLSNTNLEIEFFRIVSNLVDEDASSSFYIILKYLNKIASAKKAAFKIEDINAFITNTFIHVSEFGTIVEINSDSFSSVSKDKEIDTSNPNLVFYNILKRFFNVDVYYKSLNLMKKLLSFDVLHKQNSTSMFKYINENYFNFGGGIPHKNNNEEITYEDFDIFFSLRGLINDKKEDKTASDFMKLDEDGLSPNLHYTKIALTPIRNTMKGNGKWTNIQYKQILLSDISDKFIDDTVKVYDYPHPILIYHHFANVKDFSFKEYSEDGEKIFMNQTISWIVRFFLYGSCNDNYLNNLIYFINSGLDFDISFEASLRNTPELHHFLLDCLFTQFCKDQNPKTKIKNFAYQDKCIDFLQINEKHVETIKNVIDSNKEISTEILEKELTNTDYDIYSDDSKNAIKGKFKEIKAIDDIIDLYREWKNSADILVNQNIFDNVHSELFKQSEKLDNPFGTWFLNDTIPLFNRQVYEVSKAIFNQNEDQIKREFNILNKLINPWSDDDRALKSFWKEFVDNASFDDLSKFSSSVTRSFAIKDIIKNCQPYYICEHEETSEGNSENKTKKVLLLYRNINIMTFFIERSLYNLTILENEQDNEIKNQLFNFMINLPLVNHTKHLYILAGFVNELLKEFKDQINLLFLILEANVNCVDLLNIEQIQRIKSDNKRTESPEILEKALRAADEYNKGTNAQSKLKSYINKLIDINNSTIIHDKKKPPQIRKYRIISKENIHSYMSINNTFLPALTHLNDQNTRSIGFIINAFKVLIGNKDVEDFVCGNKNDAKNIYSDIPTIFTFKDKQFLSYKIMVTIVKINDNEDLFGFRDNAMALSLCEELSSFLSDQANKDTYRAKIWERIVNEPFDENNKPNYSSIFMTLIPLFEEYDKKLLDEHLFFKCEGWPNKETLPEKLNGIDAASHFLKSYKINNVSIFDIIKSSIKNIPPPEDSK